MERVTIEDLEHRLKVTLTRNRCSLSVEDVELLKLTIQALEELKILKNPLEKKKKIEEVSNYLFRFFANLQILQKYQKEIKGIFKHLV